MPELALLCRKKANWNFIKWNGLNIVFVIQYIHSVSKKFNFFSNIYLHIFLKMGNKMNQILSSAYSI